jgi:hypothetical protein
LRGLYQKALAIDRQASRLRLLRPGELSPEKAGESDGISLSDRERFQEQIDELLSQDRLAVTPETLAYTPKKRGLALPLVTNLTIGVVVALALAAAFFLFNRQEQSIASGQVTLLTAESKLIAALKEESEAQLKQKDQAILDIQGRLAEMDRQRQALRDSMQTDLSAKEQELQGQFERRLEEERQRLQSQGVSPEEIQRRLAETEETLRKQNQTALEAARHQAEVELASKEAAIASLASQYQSELEKAQEDRTRVQGEMHQREAELRKQMAAREQELESDRARVSDELSALRRQQEQERLLLDQLLTGYDRVNQSLRKGDYEQALAGLAAQRAFFDDRAVAGLPAVQKRRAIEFFLIDSLEELIRARQSRASTNTAALLEASSLIDAAADRVRRGQELELAGQPQAARSAYLEAMTRIPAVREGFARLEALRQADDAQARERESREWGALLRQANVFFEGGSFQESLQRYQQALSLLLGDEALSQRVTENIRDAGYRLLAADDAGNLGRLEAAEKERDEALAQLGRLSSVEQERDAALAKASRLAAAEQERDAALAKVNGLESAQAAARRDRDAVLARLRSLRSQYQAYVALQPSSAAGELDSQRSLSTLLQAKILVREILDTEPVRSRYPELNATLDRYFAALAAQKEADGRRAAVRELDSMLARLAAGEEPSSTPTFPSYPNYRRGLEADPLLALFDRLEILLR